MVTLVLNAEQAKVLKDAREAVELIDAVGSAEISLGGHTGRTVPRLITAYPGKELDS
jgi:hypothetical protein